VGILDAGAEEGGGSGAAALVTTTVVGAEAAQNQASGGRARNVIHLLGDGMGRSHVSAARERYYGAGGALNMERLPVVGQVGTYSVQKGSGQPGDPDFEPNYVPDSSSAATAWASGVKTYNAALGVDAKGVVVPTEMELAKQAGYRKGNVSTRRSPTPHQPGR
jgi:alkaline phosphatase